MSFDAIILAAGKGKRMRPFSNLISKPMLPLLNEPIIGLIAERLINSGAQSISVVTSNDNDADITNYFSTKPYAHKIKTCIQDPPKGTADAIYIGGKSSNNSNTIFSVAGDNLFSQEFFDSMVTTYTNSEVDCVMAVQEVSRERIVHLASVEVDSESMILSLIEKPTLDQVKSNLASISMYIFDRSLLEYFNTVPLSKRNEKEAPDAFLAIMTSHKLKANITKEEYIHISNPSELLHYNLKLLEHDKNEIGSNFRNSNNSVIRKSVIGDNVTIGNGVQLIECLVLPNTTIPDNYKMKNAIIAPKANGHLEIFEMSN